LLAFPLHPPQELIIVIRIVMGDGQHFRAGHLGHLQRLFVAAVSPSSFGFQFFAGVLRFMDQQISALGKRDDVRVNGVAMLDIRANESE
jgi:hypothetical protein